jgi:hypothetical protein
MILIHRPGAVPCTIYQVTLGVMQASIQRLCRVSLSIYRRSLSYLTLSTDSNTRNLRTPTGLGFPKPRHRSAPFQCSSGMCYWTRFYDSVRSGCLLTNSIHPKCYEYLTTQIRKWISYTRCLMLRMDMYA